MRSHVLKYPALASTEHDQQVALFDWANRLAPLYPCLALLFHIPNGGKRDKLVALQLQRAGVKPGVPDLCLPVSRNGWHALWIELKWNKNSTSPYQDAWLERLVEQGHKAVVCYGCDEAEAVICDYLGIDAPH